jgi:WD40 repeat protein
VFSPDSKMMASGGSNHSLILWDVWSGRAIGEPLLIGGKKRYGHRGAGVTTLAFRVNGETLVARTSEPTLLELWDVAHQPPQLVRRFDHLGGLRIVSGPGDFSPFLGSVAPSMSGSGMARSPDSQVLAFRTEGQLVLLNVGSRDGLDKPVIVSGFEGETIAFSPDGTTLATYEDGKKGTVITLWDVAALMSPDRGR